ncbi:MAG: hypothetical protein HY360_19025 [Verrucomicrobia bacterium]|nr:hypothetical protein [Verrucomicrobiota bacterium]
MLRNPGRRRAFFLPACLSVFLTGTTPAPALDRVFDFDKDPENEPPPGFVIESNDRGKALATVVAESTAPSQPNTLALCGASFPGVNRLLCLVWFSHIKDGVISVSFKHGGEKNVARTAGLTWRYQSEANAYFVECDTQRSVLSLVVVVNGKREILEKEKIPIPPNEWTALQAAFRGDEIRCDVNRKPILTARDSKLKEAGKVGILLQSNAPVLFDDLRLQSEE